MNGEITLILESDNGKLTTEISGTPNDLLTGLTKDLGTSQNVNCGKPHQGSVVKMPSSADSTSDDGQSIWLYRLYHNSVVDGPGRRSVIQVSGCSIKCPGCYVPETHNRHNGVLMPIATIVREIVENSIGSDGVTILGGEPFDQAVALSELVFRLRAHKLNIAIYSGYTIADLMRRGIPSIDYVLTHIDLLVDGPFIAKMNPHSGEYRGSRNQTFLALSDRKI